MKMRLLSKQLGNFASKYFNFIGVLALFTLYKAVNIRTNHSDQQKSPRKDVSSSNLLLKDEHLSAAQLATKYGYDAETHHIVTDDGYILEMHRINGSPENQKRNGKTPVFLMHGLLESSADRIMSGVDHALGYALADVGFDVWMGNARGNRHSRAHTSFNPDGSREDRRKFWSFSWHEIGVIDVPAMIDFILDKTHEQKLHFIGHSQGTTAFFVMCSERPEYNAKIKMMHALAPMAYVKNAVSPWIRFISASPSTLQLISSLAGVYEFLPSKGFTDWLTAIFCHNVALAAGICRNILFSSTGYNEANLNATLLPVFFAHTPAGASVRQIIHYGQVGHSDRFAQFDLRLGAFHSNKAKYDSTQPPAYNLSNVKTRVHIHYSDNDWLAAVQDVKRLLSELPNAVENRMKDGRFNHIDFIWGLDTKRLLYNDIIVTLVRHDQNKDK